MTADARPSQATRLIDRVLTSGAELWHGPDGDPYISLYADGHHEHHRLTSRAVREWIGRLHYIGESAAVGGQAIVDALLVLGGMARYEGTSHTPAVRVGAASDGRVFLDLGGPEWRAVEITLDGWRIVDEAGIRFIRARGMLALAAPERGGSVDAIREGRPLAEDGDYRVVIGWLLGALRPTGPYPLLALAGEQGAGKSTAARIIRRLVDPHVAALRAEPRDVVDVMIAAARSRVVAIDNLSHIPPWLSDALCRVSTGGALTRRELYTDGDEVIIEAIRPTIVTSIADVVTRGDLLDRAIVVTLPALDGRRQSEADLWARHAAIAPGVLGALLDGVASALRRESETRLDALPRMADWAIWVTAAEPGLGWPSGEIVEAYLAMREQAVEAGLDGDPVAVAIRAVPRPWTGTAADLLARLPLPGGRVPRGWPESPRALSAAIRRLAPALRRVGVDVSTSREPHTGRRLISLLPRDSDADLPSPPSPSSPAPYLRLGSGDDASQATVTRPSPTSSPRRPGDDGDDAPSRPSPTSSPDRANDYGPGDGGDDGDDKSPRLSEDGHDGRY